MVAGRPRIANPEYAANSENTGRELGRRLLEEFFQRQDTKSQRCHVRQQDQQSPFPLCDFPSWR